MTTENKRDLAADLALCDAVPAVHYDEGGGYTADAGLTETAMRFFEQAPEGWPHAIRRAIESEAKAGALLEILRETIDMITPNESEYKCDYRREYIRRQIVNIAPEVGADE